MSNELVELSPEQSKVLFSAGHLIRNPQALEGIHSIANIMANSKGMVPDTYINAPDKCMALIMQAGRWGLDPFAVAQKTFDLKGKIGYEGQLIQAIAECAGWDFDSEYVGAWDKIQGKHKKVKGNNGFYDQPDWIPADENGLAIILTGTHKSSGKVKTIRVDMKACYPRNSTNWTYNPQQQIHYSAVKQFTRRHCPSVVIGIHDYDDVAARNDSQPMKDVTPKNQSAESVLSSVNPEIEVVVAEKEPLIDVSGEDQKSKQKPIIDLPLENVTEKGEVITEDGEVLSPAISDTVISIRGAETVKQLNAIGLKIKANSEEGFYTNPEVVELQKAYKTKQEKLKSA